MPGNGTLDYAKGLFFLDYAVSILLTSMSGCINFRIWWEVFTLDWEVYIHFRQYQGYITLDFAGGILL